MRYGHGCSGSESSCLCKVCVNPFNRCQDISLVAWQSITKAGRIYLFISFHGNPWNLSRYLATKVVDRPTDWKTLLPPEPLIDKSKSNILEKYCSSEYFVSYKYNIQTSFTWDKVANFSTTVNGILLTKNMMVWLPILIYQNVFVYTFFKASRSRKSVLVSRDSESACTIPGALKLKQLNVIRQ